MSPRSFLIVWLVGVVLVVAFNGPILVRMLRRDAELGESPEEVRQRRRRGIFLLINTIVGLIATLALILFVFPLILNG